MNVLRSSVLLRRGYNKQFHCQYCKRNLNDFPSTYNPATVENNWYDIWERNGYFSPHNSDKELFSIILPPPNVTGILHLGHSLTATIEDVLARWHRMKGHPVVWLPGTDHAGIATQVVVEKYLQQTKGLSRHDLGKEEFLTLVDNWKNEKEIVIREQLQSIGASLDWSRKFFTMSREHGNAVTEAFVRLSERNLISRRKSIVNWSPALRSALSDIEVEYVSVKQKTELEIPGHFAKIPFGQIAEFSYQLKNSDEALVVASTRPETMLGDVAVAVHPEDERYSRHIGSEVWHPFRKTFIPVIADSVVDKNFGTGAVKISPAHDPVDFGVAKRHNLQIIDVIDENGNIISNVEGFEGLPRFTAREKILNELANCKALRMVKDHEMMIPKCSRSGDIVEYLLRDQWFVDCKSMAAKALKAVESGELTIDPAIHERTWYNYLENIRDWCVSRQLWWGHRIPAYLCENNEKSQWIVARTADEARIKAEAELGTGVRVTQDNDVLDTWFSSALLPFSTMGWPNQTDDLKKFYPLTMLETGHDILFFWVARMVMLGSELTGQLPFKEILLHGIVCDKQGRKMSKSRGNVISPEDIVHGISLKVNVQADAKLSAINLFDKRKDFFADPCYDAVLYKICQDIRLIVLCNIPSNMVRFTPIMCWKDLNKKAEDNYMAGIFSQTELNRTIRQNCETYPNGISSHGTDSLRLTLSSYNMKHYDVNFDISDCMKNKLFCNKLWQAGRFVSIASKRHTIAHSETITIFDKWILSRLSFMIETVNEAFLHRNIHVGVIALKQFLHHEFCDWYLEATKPGLAELESTTANGHLQTLIQCLDAYLRTIAPITPYLADELYSILSNQIPSFLSRRSLMEASYPTTEFQRFRNIDLEEKVNIIWKVVSSVRSLLSVHKKNSKVKEVHIVVQTPENVDLYESNQRIISGLCKIQPIKVMLESNYCKVNNSVLDTSGNDYTVYLLLETLHNEVEIENRTRRKILLLEKELKRWEQITSEPGYIAQAREDVKKNHTQKMNALRQQLNKLDEMKVSRQ